jgi:hypothetical protein
MNKNKTITPAHRAVLDAGFTVESGARALGLQESTFRRVLKNGGLSKLRCRRAARFFGCSGDLFFHPASYYQEQRSHEEQSSRGCRISRQNRMRRMDAVSNVAAGGDTLEIPMTSTRKDSPRASRYTRSSNQNTKKRRWE